MNTVRRLLARAGSAVSWMAAGVCVSVLLLSGFGYRAIQDRQRTSRQLLEQRTRDAADLLITALLRDMRGVQDSVLLSSHWTAATLDSPYELNRLLASAFARYPYPESFFGWRGEPAPETVVFFNRADRRPSWAEKPAVSAPFPLVVTRNPRMAGQLADRLRRASRDGEIGVADLEIGGVPHQLVTRLLY